MAVQEPTTKAQDGDVMSDVQTKDQREKWKGKEVYGVSWKKTGYSGAGLEEEEE